MDAASEDPGAIGAARKRISTACEACRATKIRCQPSELPGVCQKCLASKRECISRSGPRTPSPVGCSQPPFQGRGEQSFSAMPAKPEVDDNFETLRESHEQFIEKLFPDDDDAVSMSNLTTTSFGGGLQTPPSSSVHSHSIQDFQGKPSFNLASAESLLKSFRSMLEYFPCIALPPDATVSQLAATRPFVLLAILAAASGSKTLQGHSLYDDEFRKVLGLKFVAGGERSLELLQGILVYCGWYPFHLRPKNKQAIQYIRMATDLIQDLELDQEFQTYTDPMGSEVTDQQLEGIRAYLGSIYVVSTFLVTWKSRKGLSVAFTPWTDACSDILERNAQTEGDNVLASLYRLSGVLYEAAEAMHERKGQSEQHGRLLLAGLELQFREVQRLMPSSAVSSVPIKLQTMFIDIYLDGGSILKLPQASHSASLSTGPLPPTASKLQEATGKLKVFLDHIADLDERSFLAFTLNDWTRLILTIILALRLSFPVAQCPEFDAAWARSQLQFGAFLTRMCREEDLTPASKKVDVLSASRVVMRVVRDKYERRLGALLEGAAPAPGKSHGCPMLDGSLEQYFPLWDAGFAPMGAPHGHAVAADGSSGGTAVDQPVFHDLWATMTMGWAEGGSMFGDMD
ncbi:High-affinity nicotinic acid transporter [Purpureocillium lavendulum]|uniref:High-affinity nicotinic acid transporter n=1 Tax=Purpureocillium lavendulum TaxID=1247861 RepID=A0AB34G0G5_9HYPO|nr:High-affinity nicotinic acid transporter [Purpureocillium lavendulum]